MTITLRQALEDNLAETPVTLPAFQRVVARLYATGVILREESEVEARLYDDAVRIEPLLHDYFGLLAFHLHHNPQFHYFRLYPPEQAEDGDEREMPRLRAALKGDFAAYLLALRHLYMLGLDTGSVNEAGEVAASLPEIQQAMGLLLNTEVPVTRSRRVAVYMELRGQRLVRLPDGFGEEPEDLMLLIRPTILDFVQEQHVLAARAALGGLAAEGEPDEDAADDAAA